MLRVAAVAAQICDSLAVPVKKDTIIGACLLHDMGNILKFKFDFVDFPQEFYGGPEGVVYWQSVQNEYIQKYGTHEDEITLKIVKELRVFGEVEDLLGKILSPAIKDPLTDFVLEPYICKYADTRVGPHGVLPLKSRLIDEWKKRDPVRAANADILYKIFSGVEKQIFSQTKIVPESITDASITSYIEKLKNFNL